MKIKKAKLVKIQGDEEFNDILNAEGDLCLDGKNNWFNPNQSFDMVSLKVKRIDEKDGLIKIKTELGNTFIFRWL